MTDRRSWTKSLLLLVWIGVFIALGTHESRPLALGLRFLGNLSPDLLAGLGTVVGFWALGGPLRHWIVPDFATDDRPTRALLEIGLGFSVALLFTSLLGSAGLLPSVCQGLFGIGIVGAAFRVRSERVFTSIDQIHWSSWGLPLIALALVFPVVFELVAPLVGPDEAQYHRRFVEQILRTGSVPGDIEDPVSGFALGLHSIGSVPASITDVGALRPFSFLLGALGLFGGERLLRRCFGSGGAWIYLLVVVSSVTLMRALPSFNTDLSLSLLVILVAILALDWAQSPSSPGGRPWAMAIVGGAALSAKFIAPLFIAPFYLVVAIAILWDSRTKQRGRLLLKLCLAALVPALFALPWLIKNQMLAGHPLYPIGGLSFPDFAPTAFSFNFDENFGSGRSAAALLHVPWDLFITGREFDARHYMGRFGFWPLVAIPGVLLIASRSRVVLLLALASLAGFFLWAGILMRAVYLLPLWPVLAALTAGGLMALLPAAPGRARAAATAALALSRLNSRRARAGLGGPASGPPRCSRRGEANRLSSPAHAGGWRTRLDSTKQLARRGGRTVLVLGLVGSPQSTRLDGWRKLHPSARTHPPAR